MTNVIQYNESLVRGFGNEFLFVIVFTILFVIVALYIIFRYYNDRTTTDFHQLDDENEQSPRAYNPEQTCAICLSERKLSVETNCGHIFCGLCLKTMYYHNSCRIISCPICRQRATMVFIYFTEGERNNTEEETTESRDLVCNFVNHYNRRFSGRPRTIADYFMEIPILLRHLWNDFFTVGGLLRYRLRIRILICVVSAGIYLLVPTDAIPEAVFGLLGLVDDIMVISLVILYLCVLYRNVVANGNIPIRNFVLF